MAVILKVGSWPQRSVLKTDMFSIITGDIAEAALGDLADNLVELG